MKLSKLLVESKRRNLTNRLGLTDFFRYKYGYYQKCNICNQIRDVAPGTGVCTDCLLYKLKVKNTFVSKFTFRNIYVVYLYCLSLKVFLADILDDIKREPLLIIPFSGLTFVIIIFITMILRIIGVF